MLLRPGGACASANQGLLLPGSNIPQVDPAPVCPGDSRKPSGPLTLSPRPHPLCLSLFGSLARQPFLGKLLGRGQHFLPSFLLLISCSSLHQSGTPTPEKQPHIRTPLSSVPSQCLSRMRALLPPGTFSNVCTNLVATHGRGTFAAPGRGQRCPRPTTHRTAACSRVTLRCPSAHTPRSSCPCLPPATPQIPPLPLCHLLLQPSLSHGPSLLGASSLGSDPFFSDPLPLTRFLGISTSSHPSIPLSLQPCCPTPHSSSPSQALSALDLSCLPRVTTEIRLSDFHHPLF